MSQQNVEVARRLVEAWTQNDLDLALELSDPEVVIDRSNSIADARIYRGREEAERFWNDWTDAWKEFRWEVDEYIDAGEHVVVIGRFHGRGAASGAEVNANFSQVFTFRAGKLIRTHLFQSRAEAMEAAGLRV